MRWLRSHGAPAQDVSVYTSDMRELFHLHTKEECIAMLSKLSFKWSAPFYQYYRQNIDPDIESIARWAIDPFGIYDPYSGVTSNQAEGLNYVLKELQEWREAPLDCMALSLNYLQAYYSTEVSRGKQGIGNYHLHAKFYSIRDTQPTLFQEPETYIPEQIVSIQDKMYQENKTSFTWRKTQIQGIST